MPRAQTNRAQVLERRRLVERMLVALVPRHRIVAEVSTQFEVAAKTVDDDIEVVSALLARDGAGDRPRRKAIMRATLASTLRRALDRNDFKSAVGLLDKLCRLDGLYESTSVRVEGAVGIGVTKPEATMTSAEKREAFAQMMRMAGIDVPTDAEPKLDEPG